MSESKDSHEAAWLAIEDRPAFRQLLSDKIRFIVPMCLFFLVFYFLLPLLVGLAPDLMKKKVWGAVNVAYLFALSQFFMTWAVAIAYARKAAQFDRRAHEIVSDLEK
ncbi:MAG: DUF485 domain-containing protein [Verrucomicrobiae bacterium]|nr:DUF485 domain-containing protein [Verrucomicrobiae bacterium]